MSDYYAGVADVIESLADAADDSLPPGARNDWQSVRDISDLMAAITALMRVDGISMETPYFDARVLQLCLSLPGYERSSYDVFKPLVAAAFPDLPQLLLGRVTKGYMIGAAKNIVAARHDDLRRHVENSRLVDNGVFSRRKLKRHLGDMRLGIEGASQHGIDQFLSTEIWLSNLSYTRWKED